eukprot:TRINITY_DN37374_c0_g1_i1.p1 TRINITY_DN37374_c0_g1~~TRINITY_DN37374_c0_g1_i1.p1  ORF type:complete len:109 (+),score=13.16 TRINITY_DN37374_c0_g1_i1:144-470(+)
MIIISIQYCYSTSVLFTIIPNLHPVNDFTMIIGNNTIGNIIVVQTSILIRQHDIAISYIILSLEFGSKDQRVSFFRNSSSDHLDLIIRPALQIILTKNGQMQRSKTAP